MTIVDSIARVIGPLAVVVLGLSAGAVLAEGAVLVPWWRSMPPESFLSWYAENASRLFNFFGPLEIASTILAAAAAASHRRRGGRGLFVAATILAVAVLGSYPVYFQQVNASFFARTIALDQIGPELARWEAWHWGRTVIAILSFAVAVLGVHARGAAGVVASR